MTLQAWKILETRAFELGRKAGGGFYCKLFKEPYKPVYGHGTTVWAAVYKAFLELDK